MRCVIRRTATTAWVTGVTIALFSACGSNSGGDSAEKAAQEQAQQTALSQAFQLLAPANNSGNLNLTPTLFWTDSQAETSWRVQIATNGQFFPLLFDQNGIPQNTTSFNVPPALLSINNTYYWRIISNTASGQVFSTNGPFIFSTTNLGTFQLVSPATGSAGISTTQTFNWTDAEGETAYRLQIGTDAAFGNIVYEKLGIAANSTSYTLPAGNLNGGTQYFWRIIATNSLTAITAGNAPFSFSTAVPTAPTMVAPANGATGVSLTPSLTWVDTAGETGYRLQVATDSAFAAPVYDNNTIPANATSFMVPAGVLANGTQYYWRLFALTPLAEIAASNAPFSFYTTVPVSFQMTSPANGSTGSTLTPTLFWADTVGETSYRLQIATDGGFAGLVYDNGILSANSTSHAVPAGVLSGGTQYFWRVLAQNTFGATTAANAPFSFSTILPTAFNQTSPTSGTTGLSLTPTLAWTDSTGETAYKIQIATTSAFTALTYENTTIAPNSTSFTVPAGILSGGTQYYWRVYATTPLGQTLSTNAPFSFFTTQPTAFNLSSPANGATGVSLTSSFFWSDATGETSYKIQISTNPGFTAIIYENAGIAANAISFALPAGVLSAGTAYYWRIIAINASDQTIAANAPFSFVTTLPTAFTLTLPSNGSTGQSTTPTFTWTDSSGESGYTLEVSTFSDFSALTYQNSSIAANSVSFSLPGGILAGGIQYYWRVTANSAFGQTIATNAPFSFVTTLPTQFTMTSPPDTATGVSVTPTFTWADSVGEQSYRLQVSANAGFTAIIFETTTISANATSYTLSGGYLNAGTQYFWRVMAVNSFGQTTASNAPFSFSTVPPGQFSLTSPANGSTGVSLTPTFTWSDSTAETGYRIQISTTNDFSAIVFQDATIAANSVNYTLGSGILNNGTTYFWKITALSPLSQLDAGNAPFTFSTTVPTPFNLTSPANNATQIGLTPTLFWSDSTGETSYRIQISTDNMFTVLVYENNSISANAVSFNVPTGVLAGGTSYFWRVIAQNNNGVTTAGNAPFTFQTIVPSQFNQISPDDAAAGVSLTPTLTWSDSTGEASYTLQIATDAGFTVIIFENQALAPNAVSSTLPGGILNSGAQYFWRVYAVNPLQQTLAGNAPFSFTTVPPGSFSMINPSNASTGVSVTPTFTWTDSSGETGYRIQIATDSGFTAITYDDATLAPNSVSFTLGPGVLLDGTQYFWRVIALTSLNPITASNAPFSFVTSVPTAFSLTSPVNGSANASLTPTVFWSDATGETTYRLQVSTSSTFATLLYENQTIAANSASFAIPSGILAGGTQYFWRVFAVNSFGQTLASNAPFSFTTMAPSTFALSTPVDGAAGLSMTPTLVWTDATGESNYRVQIATDSNFTALVYDNPLVNPNTTSLVVPSGTLTGGEQYFWRVIATAGTLQTTASNAPFSFITLFPTSFTLVSPANNASGVSLTPTLTWTDSTGEKNYRLEVATDSGFTTVVFQDSTIAPNATVYTIAPGLLNDGTIYFWRVTALTTLSNVIATNAPFSFETTAPSAFNLTSPANGATGQTFTPTFFWGDSTGETSYKFQLATAPAFGTILYENSSLSANAISLTLPSGLLSAGTAYYWRVTAINTSGQTTASNAPFSFVTSLPATFNLAFPANNATGVSTSPTFTWNDTSGESGYTLDISTASDFSALTYQNTAIPANSTSFSVPAGTLAGGTQYYWRVLANSPFGNTIASNAPFSLVTTFPTAFILTLPVDTATGVSLTPTLNWSDSTGESSYKIQISTNALFTSVIFENSSIAANATSTTVSSGILSAGTQYFWRVMAVNSFGQTTASNAPFSFSTVPPTQFNLSSPSNSAGGVSLTPTFTWSDSTGETGYRLEISTLNDFSVIAFQDNAIAPNSINYTLAPAILNGGMIYYWRVTALSPITNVTASNAPFSFSTTVPTPFNITSPANGAAGIGLTPTLFWQSSAGTTTYRVQVATDAGFTAIVYDNTSVSGSSVSLVVPSGSLVGGTTYFWRVIAQNVNGTTTATNAPFSFTTTAPTAFTMVTPSDTAAGISLTPTMTWTDSTAEANYRLQIATDVNFTAMVFENQTINANVTSLTVPGGTLSGGTQYFWRVFAVNPLQQTLASNAPFSFSTVPPSSFTMTTPSNGASGVPVTPTFIWTDSTGESGYELQIATDSAFGAIVYDNNGIAQNSTSLTLPPGTLLDGTQYYWRVIALTGLSPITATNAPFSFVTSVPTNFTISSPVDGAVNISFTPTFFWADALGETTYRLQVSTNAAFTTLVYDNSSIAANTTAFTLPSGNLSGGTQYFWRAYAVNSFGATLASNAPFSFNTIAPSSFSLSSPTDGASGVSLTPSLSWTDSTGESNYRVQIATDAIFATVVYDNSAVNANITTLAIPGGTLNGGEQYYWRVIAIAGAQQTTASNAPLSFTTVFPTSFVLTAPANNSTGVATNPTFTWTDSTGEKNYRLQISSDSGFGTIVFQDNAIAANTTSYTLAPGILNDGTVYFWRVTALTTLSQVTGTNAPFSFETTVPTTFSLTAPANGATGQSLTPTLFWTDATGETTYKVQIATDVGFTVMIYENSLISANIITFTVPSGILTGGTQYFWRIAAQNSNGSTTAGNAPFSFTTLLPTAFNMVSPAAGTTGVSTAPTLTWTDATGESSYILQIATDAGFTAIVFQNSSIAQNVTSFAVPSGNLNGGTQYFWRVQASNSAGQTTAANAPFSFTTVTPTSFNLSSPANGATGVSTTPTLSWNDSSGEANYRVQVSTDPAFGSFVVNDGAVAANTTGYTVAPALANGTTYYWRVIAETPLSSVTAGNAPFSFVTSVPTAFSQTSPASGSTGVTLTPTLMWTDAGGETAYRLQIATDAPFTTLIYDNLSISANTISFVVPSTVLVGGTQYFWRVRATNAFGETFASNAPFNFTTALPTAFTLSNPANNANGVSQTPTMTWSESSGEANYELQVATDSAFTAIVYQDLAIPANSTSVTIPPATLNGATQYYWRVTAASPGGDTIASNAPFGFVTTGPSAFTISSPASGSTGVSLAPLLTWVDSTGESTYTLQISTNVGFTGIIYENNSIAVNAASFTVPTGVLTAGTTYFWRIIAVNASGQTTATNAPFSFTTGAPTTFSLTTPTNNSTGTILTPTLTWTDSSGETGYRLQIATDTAFTAITLDDATIAQNTTSFTVGAAVLTASTQYYWRITALSGGALTTIASNAPFAFFTTTPSAFNLSSPASGTSNVSLSPTLFWNDAGGETSYRVQISTNVGFTAIIYENTSIAANAISFAVPSGNLSAGTQYFWRILAVNSAGQTTAGNAPFNFTTTAPTGFSLSTPVNNSTGVSLTPTLAWTDSSGETSYRVQVATDITFTAVIHDNAGIAANTTSYVIPSGTLSGNTQYYWRIIATGGTLSTTASNSPFAFTTFSKWAKSYGGTAADIAYAVEPTSDGGYIVAGTTSSFGFATAEAWAMKVNADGIISWQKAYGGAGADKLSSVKQTADGGYVAAGTFGTDAWVVKLFSSGNVDWEFSYGGAGSDEALSVQQTADLGYVFTGKFDNGGGNTDAFVVKLTAAGGVTWANRYGGASGDSANSVYQTSDGGYVVAGSFNNTGDLDAWVLRLTAAGAVTWDNRYGGASSDEALSTQETNDGGLIVAGRTASSGAGSSDALVLKLTAAGAVSIQKTFGGTGFDKANSIQQTSDNGYIVGGSTTSFGAGGTDAFLLKLDSNLVITAQKTYGSANYEEVSSVRQAGSFFIAAGVTNTFGAGDFDFWVLKAGSDLTLSPVAGTLTITVNTPAVSVNAIGSAPTATGVAASATAATVTNTAATVNQQAP